MHPPSVIGNVSLIAVLDRHDFRRESANRGRRVLGNIITTQIRANVQGCDPTVLRVKRRCPDGCCESLANVFGFVVEVSVRRS